MDTSALWETHPLLFCTSTLIKVLVHLFHFRAVLHLLKSLFTCFISEQCVESRLQEKMNSAMDISIKQEKPEYISIKQEKPEDISIKQEELEDISIKHEELEDISIKQEELEDHPQLSK